MDTYICDVNAKFPWPLISAMRVGHDTPLNELMNLGNEVTFQTVESHKLGSQSSFCMPFKYTEYRKGSHWTSSKAPEIQGYRKVWDTSSLHASDWMMTKSPWTWLLRTIPTRPAQYSRLTVLQLIQKQSNKVFIKSQLDRSAHVHLTSTSKYPLA